MASGGCNKRSLIIEHIMLIGFLLCMGMIPFHLCLLDNSGGGSKIEGSCMETERRALLNIRADIYDPDNWLSSWTGQECCQWRGVGCDNTSGHVVKLNLRYPYFYDVELNLGYPYFYDGDYEIGKSPQSSKVNPSISSLMYLRYLDLSMNNFSGAPIPKFIGSLIHLEYLNLSHALIGGAIPHQIGNLSKLHTLDLGNNWDEFYTHALHANDLQWLSQISSLQYLDLSLVDLSKASNWLHEINMHPSLLVLKLYYTGLPGIPSTLQHVNFTSLTMLDLSENDFQSAIIPGWLLNVTRLVKLELYDCNFHGRLSILVDMLGNLNRLKYLDFSWNQITEDISQSLWNNEHIEHLDLSGNYITGHTIEMLGNLSLLRYLSLSGNQISGKISENLGNLSYLNYLDLSGNKISGEIPKSMENLYNLEELHLSYNQIRGWMPEEIFGKHSQLRILYLGGNQISSEILRNLRNLSHLEFLDLSDNKISGEIPKSMGNLYNLEELHLSYNQITRWMPEEIFKKHSQLRILNLGGNQISGEILQNLRNLSHLEYLYLSDNIISGEIPSSMSNLLNLERLDLSYNRITGWIVEKELENQSKLRRLNLEGNQISVEILQNLRNLSHLEYLDLSDNKISGEIPNSMGYLLNLERLDLSYNRITGWIVEKELGNQSKLRRLNLEGNQISVEILQNLRNLSHLEFLDLSDNIIIGDLPESVGQLSTLMMLDLSTNSLTGYVTEVHFSNLTRLDYLDLSYNSLKMSLSDDWIPSFNATAIYLCACHVGPKFPAWLQTQTYLEGLCLSEAGISDKIPPWLWYRDIPYLNVSHNRMEGGIPSSLGIHTREFLDLSSNCFSGPVPNLKADYMFLSSNSFSGPISWSFSGKYPSSPVVLSLSHNHINGSIPHILCNWTFLEVLDLSNNELTGGFPDCWSKSQSGILDTSSMVAYPMYLQSLHMRNNSLSGKFPSFLRLCKGLVILDLGENRFSGNIPTWIGQGLSSLRVLRLRSNFFDGNIPMQISTLSFLRVLDLACNNFSGNLPSSFSNFTAMSELQDGSKPMHSRNVTVRYYKESLLIIAKGSELEYTSVLFLVTSIDLSQNNLFGEIPKELTDLRGLRFLNLSWNHFIGEIPQNIGDMRLLESLDLSMNDLSGQIPQTMLALNFLSLLNLSYNNLSGRIPSGNQFSTFNDPSIYIGNHDLCGQPLPDCPADAPPHQEDGGEVDKEDYDMIGIYATSALGFILGFWGFLGTMMIKKDIRISYLRFIDGICDWVYTELAIKFAKLKFVIGRSNHKHG